MIPSLYPIYNPRTRELTDGSSVAVCDYCKKKHKKNDPACLNHYKQLEGKYHGYYLCPSGFTSRVFYFSGELWVITGIIPFPRFQTQPEMDKAKRYPEVRSTRVAVDNMIKLFTKLEELRADVIQEGAKVLPQAFHELRKLNGAIVQHAEKQLKTEPDSPSLRSILSAAQLMRNNFDILEALSNIDSMKALPTDASINVFDLIYKTKCVLTEKANQKSMVINLTGVRAIIRGSQKSFPIVPAVFIENAIKYGRPHGAITINVAVVDNRVMIVVENATDHSIDPNSCFERGSRYVDNTVEGGGYGLFLAKEIVLAHRGSIRCEVAAGKVRMIVEVPLVKVIK